MKNRYYVAYGSNLNIGQMQFRCPDAKVVGSGFINGYELLFKGSKSGSYLTIEKKKGSRVPIGIWKVSKLDELNLDRYEGYPAFYYKQDMDITIKDKNKEKKITAFVYIMHEERECGMPSQSYVNTCVEGYEEFGISVSYLAKAIERSREEMGKYGQNEDTI